MRTLPLLLTIAILAACGSTASAALVDTIDFNDGNWNVVVTTFGASPTDGGSGATVDGSGLVVDENSVSDLSSNGVLVTATLTGSIDTTGFHNLQLFFSNSGDNEDHDQVFGTSGDGFDITSTAGISFDTNGAAGAFLTDLNNGTDWDPTNAATRGQDLNFGASVNNSSITNLVIRLQVNANDEIINLNGFQLMGTPEPSSMALMGVGLLGAFGASRRRKKDAAV